jgi:hypothetical protein
MVTGPGFLSSNQPDKGRATAYRDSSGPDSRSDARYATIVGDWEEPSGECRVKAQRIVEGPQAWRGPAMAKCDDWIYDKTTEIWYISAEKVRLGAPYNCIL